MSQENERLVKTYRQLEAHRTRRNRWLAAGAGGVAVSATLGALTGHLDIGFAGAALSMLAVEGEVLELSDLVSDERRAMAANIAGLEAPELVTVVPLMELEVPTE